MNKQKLYCIAKSDTFKTTSFHLENIFAVMCRLVEADYNTVDRTKEDWYLQYQWDEETEKRFSNWLTEYLHKIPQAQSELYGRRYMKKYECKSAVQMFLLSYGWKTCLLYTSPSPRDRTRSRMPSSA